MIEPKNYLSTAERFFVGVLIAALALIYQHAIVKPGDYRKVTQNYSCEMIQSKTILLSEDFYRHNVTINGGTVNDSLNGGAGNDFIYNFGESATIIGGDGADFFYSDGNVILIFDDKNSLTLSNAADKRISFLAGNKNYFTNHASIDSSRAGATLTSTATKFNAAGVSAAVNVLGNAKTNMILAGAHGATLDGGRGKDTLIGGSIKNDDVILKVGGNKITVKGATILGGTGNDTLIGGDGADEFIYNKGVGKDVILGFDNDDLLRLKDFIATSFNINDDAYRISGNKLTNARAMRNA